MTTNIKPQVGDVWESFNVIIRKVIALHEEKAWTQSMDSHDKHAVCSLEDKTIFHKRINPPMPEEKPDFIVLPIDWDSTLFPTYKGRMLLNGIEVHGHKGYRVVWSTNDPNWKHGDPYRFFPFNEEGRMKYFIAMLDKENEQ